jgi:hypothetical protein
MGGPTQDRSGATAPAFFTSHTTSSATERDVELIAPHILHQSNTYARWATERPERRRTARGWGTRTPGRSGDVDRDPRGEPIERRSSPGGRAPGPSRGHPELAQRSTTTSTDPKELA